MAENRREYEKTVIDGELVINGTLTLGSGATLPAATETTKGMVKMAENVAEASGANPTAAEFKALLDALISAGVMAAPQTEG
jgi:phage-related tail fiber protein